MMYYLLETSWSIYKLAMKSNACAYKSTGYGVNMQISIIFMYVNSEQLKLKIFKYLQHETQV